MLYVEIRLPRWDIGRADTVEICRDWADAVIVPQTVHPESVWAVVADTETLGELVYDLSCMGRVVITRIHDEEEDEEGDEYGKTEWFRAFRKLLLTGRGDMPQ